MNDLSQEIAHLEGVIAQQQTLLADLEAEWLDLQHEVDDFQQRYNRIVHPVEVRLEAVQAAIAELERQHYQTWDDHPLGNYAPLESTWEPPEDYVPVEEQFRRAWQKPPLVDDLPEAPTTAKPKPRATARDDRENRIKKLYRQLARRYHPDLVADPSDRDARTQLMARINEAYTRRDLAALQALADQPEDASADQPLAALRLKELRQVREQLRQRIAELRFDLVDLRASDMLKLTLEEKIIRRRGGNMLADMAAQLEREYDAAMRRLHRLR